MVSKLRFDNFRKVVKSVPPTPAPPPPATDTLSPPSTPSPVANTLWLSPKCANTLAPSDTGNVCKSIVTNRLVSHSCNSTNGCRDEIKMRLGDEASPYHRTSSKQACKAVSFNSPSKKCVGCCYGSNPSNIKINDCVCKHLANSRPLATSSFGISAVHPKNGTEEV